MADVNSSGEGSISEWIEGLKQGEQEAATRLWVRFFGQLKAIARQKLGAFPSPVVDHEDLALSTLFALMQGTQDGQFDHVGNRNDFWQLALVILSRKASNIRRAKIARKEICATDLSDSESLDYPSLIFEQATRSSPTEYGLHSLGIECDEVLDLLDEPLRRVALLKLAGLTNEEISGCLDRSVKTTERYLKEIRTIWGRTI